MPYLGHRRAAGRCATRDHRAVQTGSLKGRLLVATPMLGDPNFDRTVILVLEHGVEGAVGVVLNRPSDTAVAGALPAWAELAAEPAAVYIGGPVGPTVLVGLGERRDGDGNGLDGGDGDGLGDADDDGSGDRQHWTQLLGAIGTIDLGRDPAALDPPLARVRVFAGYAGWGEGQLEGEIEVRAWFVVDARPADAMTDAPEHLWRDVLRRQRDDLRLLASYPRNPSTN